MGNTEHLKEIFVEGNIVRVGDVQYACVIGKAGLADDKREGDNRTPKGSFPLRPGYFRPDRVKLPETPLGMTGLMPNDGWCDDPKHPAYNMPVTLPFNASHEKLWREDHCYDVIIPLGYNDDPVVPGKGSAIFLHCMHDSGRATEGCVALKKEDLLALLPRFSSATRLTIL